MKKSLFKRGMAGLLSLVMCLTALVGLGTTTAFAAGEQAEVYLISFPRSGDANLDYGGSWGHPNLQYMNGWYSGNSKYTTIRAMHSYEGNICYCIEPGTAQETGDRYTSKDETFWDNLPADFNSTISPYEMKLFIGRIMQYGYTGPISTSWRSQNSADAAALAEAMATQVLIWETIVGERDADFDHVSPGSYDAVKESVSAEHPLYSRFCSYYDSIVASVQRHSTVPSFMSKNAYRAQSVELAWDGTNYTATLTDSNRVLSDYSFSANEDGISFSVSGNKLTITAANAPSGSVRITASKTGSTRRGIITWTDGRYAPGAGIQDVISYAQSVSDPVQAFLNLKVSYGSAKIVKTSEDGKVDNLTFTVTGNGVNQTVKTNARGEIQIDNLMPGVYTVTEQDYDKYEPQESRRVTVVSGQVSTVNFNNKLKRGNLQIIKSSEDSLVEGVTFHLYGTSLSGMAVDEYAVTDKNGVAAFKDVLISGSSPYTVEEVDTAVRYVVPEAQIAPVKWNEVTSRSFTNILKKFTVTVTKSDAETGTAQGDASLAGAVYGIYKGETLVDSYATDKNGQFTSKEYICDSDWTVREITPSEGYLLDNTVHKVGAEPQLYTVEHNQTANDVTEQVVKGNIAIIKHTDNGETQIETPEGGAEFAVYLKAAGSYENAKSSERDYLTCDENGFAQTKELPYGIYTVHQVSGWEGSEKMPDFDVFIAQNGTTYRYLINNTPFESYIKVVKVDAETGKSIPYAGAGFQIYDPAGNLVTMTYTYPTPTSIDTFYTDANGALVTPEKLDFGSGYALVEVQAPYGYVLDSTPVYFDVTEENATEESGVTVVKVDKPNMAQKGTITVEKTGEVFFGVSVTGGKDEGGKELPTVYQPQYEKRGLPGAVYEIIAAEDITTPDGTVRNQKGEVVDTVTTDENGVAKSRELYLGKYEVREITAPHGNVQTKLAALHHLDCPWRPSDLQQREGRIIRQGNENREVDIYTYVTENTFDSYLYQLVESKQKFIGQIMTSKSPVRSAEDIDETALSYAEIKALCAGNPHIKEKMDLDIDVSRLKLLKANHLSQRYSLEDQILKEFPQKIKSLEQRIEGYQADIDQRKRNTEPNEDGFSPMFMPGGTVREKKAAGDAILGLCKSMTSPDPIPIGQYRGFDTAHVVEQTGDAQEHIGRSATVLLLEKRFGIGITLHSGFG